jgi:hypothetical protein
MFARHRASTPDQAVSLARASPEGRFLAGGQSLHLSCRERVRLIPPLRYEGFRTRAPRPPQRTLEASDGTH